MNCELDNLGQACCVDIVIGGVKSIYLARVSDVDYLTYSNSKVNSFVAKPAKVVDWLKFEFSRESVRLTQDVVTDKFNLSYDITVTGRLTGITATQIANLQSLWHTPCIAILETINGAALTIGYREGLRLGKSTFETGAAAEEQFGWNLNLGGKTTHPIYICTDAVTNQLVDLCTPTNSPVTSCATEQADMLTLINDLLDAELAYAAGNGNQGLNQWQAGLSFAQTLNALGLAMPTIPNGWQVVRHTEASIIDDVTDWHSVGSGRVSSGNYFLAESPIRQTTTGWAYAGPPGAEFEDELYRHPPIIAWVAVPVTSSCPLAYPITGAIAQVQYEIYSGSPGGFVTYRAFGTKQISVSPDTISPYPVINVNYATVADITTNQAPTLTGGYLGSSYCQNFSTMQINALSMPVFQHNLQVLTPYRTYTYTFVVDSALSGAFVNLFIHSNTTNPNPVNGQVSITGLFAGQVVTGTVTNQQDVRLIAFRCEISQIVFTC